MRLPKHTTLKAALLTLAAAASLGAHAATVQDEAIAFATNNPMSLTVQGDDIAVNLTTNTALQPGAHVEQKSDKPCPVSLTTANNNGNETLTIKRVDNTQPCTAVVAVNLPEKSTLGVRQKTPLIYANGNFGKITTDSEHLTFTLQGRVDSLELNAAGAVTSSIHVQQLPISLISIRARHMATSIRAQRQPMKSTPPSKSSRRACQAQTPATPPSACRAIPWSVRPATSKADPLS